RSSLPFGLLPVLLFLSCCSTAVSPMGAPSRSIADRAHQSAPVTLPFELVDNLILISITVNDSQPQTFILDSGAGVSVINRSRAIALGLKPTELGERGDFGIGEGRTKLAIVKGISVGLSGVELPLRSAIVLPFDDEEAMIGRPIVGVIG